MILASPTLCFTKFSREIHRSRIVGGAQERNTSKACFICTTVIKLKFHLSLYDQQKRSLDIAQMIRDLSSLLTRLAVDIKDSETDEQPYQRSRRLIYRFNIHINRGIRFISSVSNTSPLSRSLELRPRVGRRNSCTAIAVSFPYSVP